MVLLQPKLNLRVSQKQILTPGLVQMVSVLALNKMELKDMISSELEENPVLDEFESAVPTLDEVSAKEEQRDRDAAAATAEEPPAPAEEKDPFDEIDFGSFFQDYLDPGYRSNVELEEIERPSFENFLSKPTTLTDHLMWQLGAMHVKDDVLAAAELVIGNLSEDGYLLASDEELLTLGAYGMKPPTGENGAADLVSYDAPSEPASELSELSEFAAEAGAGEPQTSGPSLVSNNHRAIGRFGRDALHEAIDLVRQMDPVGVAARDLRECLMSQLENLKRQKPANGTPHTLLNGETVEVCLCVVDKHLPMVQNKQLKEIGKALGKTVEQIQAAVDFIRTLDPKPGLRYNKTEARLIEPDVAFIKQGDEYIVVMNDEDLPQLRLNPTYRRMLTQQTAEKDVKNYVKERYKSAIQLIKNIEQRKQTILKVCLVIIARQRDFLDRGIDQLKPMMIKEVAEEIGVHPSTVSRAVSNKYVHTSQGVFELRYFFSESVQGPEGGGTSLLILKRRVKKLIEDEDPKHPLTDEQITRILQSQGIQVTRRTVAKYREDMKIPSTHQRRIKS
jgi:RNA polymerase sigma-54 factor